MNTKASRPFAKFRRLISATTLSNRIPMRAYLGTCSLPGCGPFLASSMGDIRSAQGTAEMSLCFRIPFLQGEWRTEDGGWRTASADSVSRRKDQTPCPKIGVGAEDQSVVSSLSFSTVAVHILHVLSLSILTLGEEDFMSLLSLTVVVIHSMPVCGWFSSQSWSRRKQISTRLFPII